MKVLLREYAGEQYVWMDAEKNDKNKFVVNGNTISETKIVSVSDYKAGKFVTCANCGAIIPNNKKAIEAHKNMSCDWHNCLNCSLLKIDRVELHNRKFLLQEDGTFNMSAKESVKLRCGNRYSDNEITSERMRKECRFAFCKNADMVVPNDFFAQNPGAFDDLITVDKIIECGYSKTYRGNDYTEYKLKAKNTITAFVNKLNIVDHFRISYRHDFCDVVYSKKLDQLFDIGYYQNGEYKKPTIWSMPTTSMENIKQKIASLYK